MQSSRRDFLKRCVSAAGAALASQLPGIPQMGGITETPLLLKPNVVDATGLASRLAPRAISQMPPGHAFEGLLLGIQRYSPMIIDNFGIQINMSDIPRWRELTDGERRTAFTNHVLSLVDPETEVRVREHFA